MNFESEFIKVNFDGMLPKEVSDDVYMDFIKFKLKYMIDTSKRHETFKELSKVLTPLEPNTIRFVDNSEANVKYKRLLIEQRRALSNFTGYIKNLKCRGLRPSEQPR